MKQKYLDKIREFLDGIFADTGYELSITVADENWCRARISLFGAEFEYTFAVADEGAIAFEVQEDVFIDIKYWAARRELLTGMLYTSIKGK